MQNVLLLSAGSKVALARIIAQSARVRGAVLHGIDRTYNLPTTRFVDVFHALPEGPSPDSVLDYCVANDIGLVIPSRHSDLHSFAKAKAAFGENGVSIAISSLQAIEICINKYNTVNFLSERGLPVPKTFRPEEVPSLELSSCLPLVAKPATGSAGQGVRILKTESDLLDLELSSDYMLQTEAAGAEYTVNVYASIDGKCVCAIPHKRLIVDGGESVQAITERNPVLIEFARSVVEALPGAWGPLNIQAFYDESTGKAEIIEINPRLGGGFPLANQANGAFIEWLFQEVFEKRPLKPFESWTDGLRMLRYRDAVFDLPK